MGRKPGEPLIAADAPLPDEVPVPGDLSPDAQAVWVRLAPLARQERTLTPATAQAFAMLCQAVVLESNLAKEIEDGGFLFWKVSVDGAGVEHREPKANPLITQRRGEHQRVEAGLTAFRLRPTGRPIATVSADKPKNALESLQAQRIRAVK